jgi:hypothetical protein
LNLHEETKAKLESKPKPKTEKHETPEPETDDEERDECPSLAEGADVDEGIPQRPETAASWATLSSYMQYIE